MVLNATLSRLDPPPPAEAGPAVLVRCAVAPLTAEQGRESREMNWGATLVAYVPLTRVPAPGPVVDGRALVRPDGAGGTATPYRIAHVLERLGPTLGHVQIYLAPV